MLLRGGCPERLCCPLLEGIAKGEFEIIEVGSRGSS